ncbi:hypothetical protein GIB67_012332 [Kingdonia uniflora]|uniref:Aminotransferase-like plant mobile domain-containing protein n=1 Tax=Kingdonia uniflora TaxID=39325 RepID=A0A7J7MVI0_9MAGN|nr:hypothetical protein GIB67_012332 [Kingdonia uniflora]
MHMPDGDPHSSTLPGFKGTRDPGRYVTRSRSGRKKKRVEFEDVQPQSIPNPTQENFPRRCITQLSDGVSHIYYTGKELTNRDSMRVHGTFTMVFKVWKDIATILAVPYDDTWSILSNARQLFPNIDSNHIKSGNVSIAHLRTYLTIPDDREDDITIVRTFILFMMGHLWFQTANDTVSLGYLAAVNDLDLAAQYDWGSVILASLYHGLDTAVTTGGAITGFVLLLPYWFYEYYGIGHPIVKEEVKYLAYLYHIDHRTVEMITWEPWFDSAVSETEDALNAKLLSRKRMPLQVPNKNYEYYLGDRCWRQVTDEVTSASVHRLSQDFSLPSEAKGPDLGWHMEWTGRRERLPIARLRDPPPMSSSYGVEELWHLTHGLTAEERVTYWWCRYHLEVARGRGSVDRMQY